MIDSLAELLSVSLADNVAESATMLPPASMLRDSDGDADHDADSDSDWAICMVSDGEGEKTAESDSVAVSDWLLSGDACAESLADTAALMRGLSDDENVSLTVLSGDGKKPALGDAVSELVSD